MQGHKSYRRFLHTLHDLSTLVAPLPEVVFAHAPAVPPVWQRSQSRGYPHVPLPGYLHFPHLPHYDTG